LAEIRNPNLQPRGSGGSGGGNDMRSTILMLVIFAAIMAGFGIFNPFKPPANQSQPAASQQQAAPAPAASAPGPASAQAAQAANALKIAAANETETSVENDQYKIVFTNRGAQIKHWILKHSVDSAGHPLDMVQSQAAARFGYPLSLFTYDANLDSQLNQALYQVAASGPHAVAAGSSKVSETNALTFHYAAGGVDAVKIVRFDPSYVITVETQVKRNGQTVRALVSWPAGLGDMEEFSANNSNQLPLVRSSANSSLVWLLGGKPDTLSGAKVVHNNTLSDPYEYIGVMDLYFTAAFLPDNPGRTTVATLHNWIDLPSDPSDPNSKKKPADVIGLAVGDASGYTRLRLYAGPKATEILAGIHATGADGKPSGDSLSAIIQYGWLTVIAKPLYLALRYLHNLLGGGPTSWGWAIIIFTVVFNLVFLPTRFMMMRSSLKMSRIQPKVEGIKHRYANLKATDPKRAEMNTEIMALYKKENVNIYGSCLPMLPQLPLFFAYYRVLYNAVELRQARWGWLNDLSSSDPYYILPAIILISMFLVQMMTPSPGMDKNQRRMMAIMMPIVFGYSMAHFASGLALYWCTGNVLNLIIQFFMNRSGMGREMHELAAKRAAKGALKGKR
jgi:YidC/Oxa1 family membrane protein insertase